MSSYLSPAPVNNESEAPWILVHTKLKSSHLFSLVTIVNKLTKTQPTLKLLLICSYTIRHVFIYLQNKFLTRFFPHEKARKQENFCLERNNWLIMTSLRVDFSTLCISMSAKYWQEKKKPKSTKWLTLKFQPNFYPPLLGIFNYHCMSRKVRKKAIDIKELEQRPPCLRNALLRYFNYPLFILFAFVISRWRRRTFWMRNTIFANEQTLEGANLRCQYDLWIFSTS